MIMAPFLLKSVIIALMVQYVTVQKYLALMIFILKMNKSSIIKLFLLFTSFLLGQEKTYSIKAEASFANGLLVSDAEVVLMDTTERVIQKTRTSKKIF